MHACAAPCKHWRPSRTVLFSDLPRPTTPVRRATPGGPPAVVRRQRPFPWLPVLAVLIGLSIVPVIMCFFPDPKMGGMPHALMGMLRMINLT